MKVSHHDKQFATMRVLQASASKRQAADQFRQRHIDSTLKKLLNRYEQKTQTLCHPAAIPAGDSIPETGVVDTEAGEAS